MIPVLKLMAVLAGGEPVVEVMSAEVCRKVEMAVAAGEMVEGMAFDGTIHRIVSATCVPVADEIEI